MARLPDGMQFTHPFVESGGRLWVADGNRNRNRVLRWERTSTRPHGTDADGVIGQSDFGFGSSGSGLGQFSHAGPIARDATGHLWIVDQNNERLLRFSPTTPQLAIALKNPTTLSFTCAKVVKGVQYAWLSTTNLQSWQAGSILTPDITGTMNFDLPKPADPMRCWRLMEQCFF